ncbi:MAG: hypothetical protein Kow00109_07170 [Acidobacteriota bacterium]
MPVSLTEVGEYRLDNNLRILIWPQAQCPVVVVMTWYGVGSAYDPPGKAGLAHLLEHLMFKGTSRFAPGEIDRLTSEHGGLSNAYTGQEFTTYFFAFAADRWSTALEIEADRMKGCTFHPEELERERQVILEEIHMERDDPWERLRENLEAAVRGASSYAHPIAGRPQTLRTISRPDLLEFYRRHYQPGNATVVIAGGMEPHRAVEEVARRFAAVTDDSDRRPAAPPVPGFQSPPEPLEDTWAGEVERVLFAFPAPSLAAEDYPAFLVLDRLLAQGRLCRLHRSLVEEQDLVAGFQASFEDTRAPGIYYLQFDLRDGVPPEDLVGRIRDTLEATADGDLDEALERARNQTLTGLLAELENPSDRAFLLGLWATLHRWEALETMLHRVHEVDASSVRRAARKYLLDQPPAVGILRAR